MSATALARRREWGFLTQVLYRLPFTVLALVLFLKKPCIRGSQPSRVAVPRPSVVATQNHKNR